MLTVEAPLCDPQGLAAWEIQVQSRQDLKPFVGQRVRAAAELERPTGEHYRPIVAKLTNVAAAP